MTAAAPARTPRRRRLMFVVAAIAISLLLSFLTVLAVDVYLHRKFQQSAGFNIWGYRGRPAGRKAADEYRVVVLGGSSAYGYGTNADEAMPAALERQLAGRRIGRYGRVRVINLGYNNEGAYSFAVTLKDYASLNYDIACLYEGYNDLMGDSRGPNVSVFRHESPVFRLTGYLPIFPIAFKEKAAALVYGDAGALYRDTDKTVFHAGIAARAAAGVLDATAAIGQSLERQLGKVTAESPGVVDVDQTTGCKTPWQRYCRSVHLAVDDVLQSGRQVLVVTQPYAVWSEPVRLRHVEQQAEMAAMLARRFARERRVMYVNLGPLIDLHDATLSFDHMHLTVEGNRRLASALIEPVQEMILRRSSGT